MCVAVHITLKCSYILNLHRPDVPDGSYIFSIESHDHPFDLVCCTPIPIGQSKFILFQYRIDINESSISPVEVRPYILGIPMNPPSNMVLAYPLSIAAKEKYVYFLPQQSFNLGGMLSNPMMLLMIGCGAMMLIMPYIMVRLLFFIPYEIQNVCYSESVGSRSS